MVYGLGPKEGVRVYGLGFFQKLENEKSEKGKQLPWACRVWPKIWAGGRPLTEKCSLE